MAAHMGILVQRALRRERVVRDRAHPLELYNDKELFKKYRFNHEGVIAIIELIGGDIQRPTQRSFAIPSSLQVFIALRFYATGSVIDATATIHGISRATASRVIRRVTRVLCTKRNEVNFKSSWASLVEFTLIQLRLDYGTLILVIIVLLLD